MGTVIPISELLNGDKLTCPGGHRHRAAELSFKPSCGDVKLCCDFRLGKHDFRSFRACRPTSLGARGGIGRHIRERKKLNRLSKPALAISGIADAADRWSPYWRKIQMAGAGDPPVSTGSCYSMNLESS